jgi:hypothetical protein
MKSLRYRVLAPIVAGALIGGAIYVTTPKVKAADAVPEGEQAMLPVEHAECAFFGPKREQYMQLILGNKARGGRGESAAGALTRQVTARLGNYMPGGSRSHDGSVSTTGDTIDAYVFAQLQTLGITPAESTNDYEFIRRVTIDLTGQIPTPAQVLQFVNDATPNKRANLIDNLLASPQWVDKWTMFYSDLFKNTSSNSQITINNEGRNSFYKWIHDSLANGKPYNQMAAELIAAQGTNNTDQTQGNMNFLILNNQGGGPVQDVYDAQTAGVAEAFLGLAHVNCLLCHDGRGHLDSLSLWAGHMTRYQAWQLSSFISHTGMPGTQSPINPATPTAGRLTSWAFTNGTTDYTLNTTIGNRPARQPVPGGSKTVTPMYLDGVSTPAKGADYRASLAQYVTSDMQFSRAAVNYVWKHLFSVGIVDPADQFDLARLDPNNPPPAPWTLQPSNPKLLDALARHFISSGYNIQALLREIANSQTYQFSSRYAGNWNPTWESYFARHFVRRMWGEEIHDSVVIATGIVPTYNVSGFSNASTYYGVDSAGFGPVSYAMQLPDVKNEPDGGGDVSQFLDSFLRGDRDLTPRKEEGSILQALNLMNDAFLENKIKSTGSAVAGSNLVTLLNSKISDTQLVNQLYLTVLSRYPSATELQTAVTYLGTYPNHNQSAEDLFWSLFNKVDFVFNY